LPKGAKVAVKSDNWFKDVPRVQPSKTGAKLRAEKRTEGEAGDEIPPIFK